MDDFNSILAYYQNIRHDLHSVGFGSETHAKLLLNLENIISQFATLPYAKIDYSNIYGIFNNDTFSSIVENLETYCILHDQKTELINWQQEFMKDTANFDDISLELNAIEQKLSSQHKIIEILLEKPNKSEENENQLSEIIMEIRAGAGGDEAALFVSEILQMYTMYAAKKKWKCDYIDLQHKEHYGLREATVIFEGIGVKQRLSLEGGVHRVQRVPITEANGRIHTSTVTVVVRDNIQEIKDIQIDPKDLQIEYMRASGRGGQNVQKTNSAVRITHIPTGLSVSQQDERSQNMNRNKALLVLKTRLLELKWQEQNTQASIQRQMQAGSGDRSEKIRTYNFPQNRVTDHRANITFHNLDRILCGHLDDLLDNLQ